MRIQQARRWCTSLFVRDGRLRSGWRVVSFVIAALLAIGMTDSVFNLPFSPLGSRILRMIAILATIWLFRRFIDKRSFHSLGFQVTKEWWQEAFRGFVLALLLWGTIFALALVLRAVTVVGYAWNSNDWLGIMGALVIGLLTNITIGIMEEAHTRGYVLQNLADGISIVPAIVVSSMLFGILHLPSPGGGLASTIGIFFGGVMLAMGYYATGNLWFSIGLHSAWNFAEGSILGFLVSGNNMGGLLVMSVTGPEWLMGGKFGPSAGALAIVAEIVLIAALFMWSRRNSIKRMQVSNV